MASRKNRPENVSSRKEKPESKLTQFDKYELREIERSDINFAFYNPRRISDDAKKKLRENIKKKGLMGNPAWNPNTKNLIGGHQRVQQLDSLEGSTNYRLRVYVVPMSETEEKEQNVFLNNDAAQGEWDITKLGEMLADKSINIDATGFDLGSIYRMFGDSPALAQPERLQRLSDKIRDTKKLAETLQSKFTDSDNLDFFLVVVFKDYESRVAFTEKLKLEDNRYVSGDQLFERFTEKGKE